MGKLEPEPPSSHRPKLPKARPYPEPNRPTYGPFTRPKITFDATPTKAPSSSPYFPTPPTEFPRYVPNLGLTSFGPFTRSARIPTQPAGYRPLGTMLPITTTSGRNATFNLNSHMRVFKGGVFARTPNNFLRSNNTRGKLWPMTFSLRSAPLYRGTLSARRNSSAIHHMRRLPAFGSPNCDAYPS